MYQTYIEWYEFDVNIVLMLIVTYTYIGSAKYFFFLENALKKVTEYFLKFLFLFESTILPVNNGK